MKTHKSNKSATLLFLVSLVFLVVKCFFNDILNEISSEEEVENVNENT